MRRADRHCAFNSKYISKSKDPWRVCIATRVGGASESLCRCMKKETSNQVDVDVEAKGKSKRWVWSRLLWVV